jgi:hypothetical protein
MSAEGMACLSQVALNVIDRQVLLAQSDDEFPGAIAQRSVVRSGAKDLKESLAKVRVVSEAVTKDTKGARGIAKAVGDLSGGASIDKVSTEGLVLALLRGLGGGEEQRGLLFR